MDLVRLMVNTRRRIILLFIIENIEENCLWVNVCLSVVFRKSFHLQHLKLSEHKFIEDECFARTNVYKI